MKETASFSRKFGPTMAGRDRMPRYQLHEEMFGFREGAVPPPRGRGPMPPPPHLIEEEIAIRREESRRYHADNRRLVEENVAMRRDIDAFREEVIALRQTIPNIRADKDAEARDMIQAALKLEAELRVLEPVKGELLELKSEAQKLEALRQEMTTKIQSLQQDLKRLKGENQQIQTMRMEIDGLHQELASARMAYEYEKKSNAEQMEQRQAMEKNLVSMAREIEKIRAGHINLDTRARGPGIGAFGADIGYQSPFAEGYGSEKGLYTGSWQSYGGHPRH